jgi:hypothetical protein
MARLPTPSMLALPLLITAACVQADAGHDWALDETGSGETDGEDESEDEGGLLLDVAGGADGGNTDGSIPGCERVDLLFVVDNSTSMADNQQELVASFPGFIAGIEAQLDVAGHHVGVVTTDAYEHNEAGCRSIGDLVTRTGGSYASSLVCGPYAEGGRFMTDADDLGPHFECAAQVGIDGAADERPIDAIRAVVATDSGCNEGFLRDDALLVVVVISDEDDGLANPPAPTPFTPEPGGSAGDPPDWFADIAAAKGDESRMVVLSLVSGPDVSACNASEAQPADRLSAFTDMFTHGFVGDICNPDFSVFFDEAIAVVDSACSEFEPEG